MNPICQSTQQEISFALDDHTPIPAAALEHARHCSDCAAFRSAWQGGMHDLLEAPLPPAGLALRETVLAMPRTMGFRSRGRNWRAFVSAGAAALLLGVFGYSLIDIRTTPVQVHTQRSAASKELNALKADFRRGLGALRAPANAMKLVIK